MASNWPGHDVFGFEDGEDELPENFQYCVECGEPTTLTRWSWDITDTDRGTWKQEYEEPYCGCLELDNDQ